MLELTEGPADAPTYGVKSKNKRKAEEINLDFLMQVTLRDYFEIELNGIN